MERGGLECEIRGPAILLGGIRRRIRRLSRLESRLDDIALVNHLKYSAALVTGLTYTKLIIMVRMLSVKWTMRRNMLVYSPIDRRIRFKITNVLPYIPQT